MRSELKPPNDPKVEIDYDDLLDLIEGIQDIEATDQDMDHYMEVIEFNLPNAEISDLIFWPDQWLGIPRNQEIDLSSEEIAGYALALTKVSLPGAEGIDLPEIPSSKPKARRRS